MADVTTGAFASSTTPRTTARQSFFSCNLQRDHLFSVNPGVPTKDALNHAANFLDVAAALTADAALEVDGETPADAHRMWAASYLVQICKALVNASLCDERKEKCA